MEREQDRQPSHTAWSPEGAGRSLACLSGGLPSMSLRALIIQCTCAILKVLRVMELQRLLVVADGSTSEVYAQFSLHDNTVCTREDTCIHAVATMHTL